MALSVRDDFSLDATSRPPHPGAQVLAHRRENPLDMRVRVAGFSRSNSYPRQTREGVGTSSAHGSRWCFLASPVVLRGSFIPATSLDAPHADHECPDLSTRKRFLIIGDFTQDSVNDMAILHSNRGA